MKTPQPDPRIFEKNFAMPMNPASVGEAVIGPVRRKDGLPVPAPSQPEWGGHAGQAEQPTTIRPRDKNETPPLLCKLYRKADGTRAVTVSEGRVIEFIPKSATDDVPPAKVDGVIEWPIDNIWDETYPNLLREHTIETGWSIGVLFSVDEAGYIFEEESNKVRIATRDHTLPDGDISTHYDPPVGPSIGAGGTVYVILARLVGTGDAERLHVYHGGSNVEHYHELSPFRLVDGADGEDIFDDFDVVTGDYRYLGVRGKQMDEEIGDKPADTDPKIEVLVQMASVNLVLKRADLVIDWTKGPNLNLIVRGYTLQAATVDIPITITIPSETITVTGQGGHTHEGAVINRVELAGIPVTGSTDPTDDGDGEHIHTLNYTNEVKTIAAPDDVSVSIPYDSGAHSHTIIIPEKTVTTVITVPAEPVKVPDTDYYTICFRDRLYHSVVANAGDLPSVNGGEEPITKTIWILNMDNGLDLGSETTPNAAII